MTDLVAGSATHTEWVEKARGTAARHGRSVVSVTFLRDGDRGLHTYSAYARSLDALVGTYGWLDLTVLGRQEDWEEPPGRSDGAAMPWLRRHDEYGGRQGAPDPEAEVAPAT